ncbi:MAG: hypothetical protein AB7N99_01295 [Simkaniaceae bacterium]
MTVEAIDSTVIASENNFDWDNTLPQWNGRGVHRSSPKIQASAIFAQAFFSNLKPTPICLKGSAGVSGETDSEGNKEIEGHISVSNESGSVSVDVHGGVSQDAEGNTNASGGFGIEWSF